MFCYPEAVNQVICKLKSSGFPAYIVGGCVRDFIMGVPPHDYDIATAALPEEIMSVFSDYTVIPTGIAHGTVTLLVDSMPIEITTFRTDGKYSDNRHPASVSFAPTFKDDASRRDFTINAMAYNNDEGLLDYFGGKSDIENRIIRCVGVPDVRFGEDALRILRALRFSSVLGFEIENETRYCAIKNRHLLTSISAERTACEFLKLLCGNNVKNVLLEYSDIIGVFIPEILPMVGFKQHNPHHIYDVWTHTAVVVESILPVPYLRLAAFFHDIGKPSSFITDDIFIGHFYGHAEKSVIIAEKVMKRLKLDSRTINKALAIIKNHDLRMPENKKVIKRHMNRLSPDLFFDLIHMFRADNLAKSPQYASRVKHFDALESIANEILSEQTCFSLGSLAVNGDDIINMGIPEGKQIGKALNALLELVINEELPNKKDVLLEYVKENKDSF